MSRPLRIEFSGALYHLTSRGNAQGDIYLSDVDRRYFLGLLSDVNRPRGQVLHCAGTMGSQELQELQELWGQVLYCA